MYKNLLNIYFIILLIVLIFFNIIFFYNNSTNIISTSNPNQFHFSNNSNFSWPIPGFHNITSNFGIRIHPISKKSSFHSGIDISAPAGTSLYAITSGIVTFTNFNGANGYSIHISNGELEFIYAHVSPYYIVSVNEIITQNQIIGHVGPKYVDKVPENNYTDSSGNFLNGSTTGPHLHFSIKKDGKAVNPLDYF